VKAALGLAVEWIYSVIAIKKEETVAVVVR
jgi:hypothetical protein